LKTLPKLLLGSLQFAFVLPELTCLRQLLQQNRQKKNENGSIIKSVARISHLVEKSFGRKVHWPKSPLVKKSFGQKVIWLKSHFGRKFIWSKSHLVKKSFGQKDIWSKSH
jgi:hypothetical protein